MNLEERLKRAWAKYPEAKVTIKSVSSSKEVPIQGPRQKIAIYLRRGARTDSIYVVKHVHRFVGDLKKGTNLDDFSDADLRAVGALPYAEGNYCEECGEFTPVIFVSHSQRRLCHPCLQKEPKQQFPKTSLTH